MYSYYCLAALGPNVRKYLWWKRYLTIVQMVQFVLALIHACIPLFVDCGYHPGFAYALIAHAILFWVMFYNFYQKNYNPNNNYIQNNNNNNIRLKDFEKINGNDCNQNEKLINGLTDSHSVLSNGNMSGIQKKIN